MVQDEYLLPAPASKHVIHGLIAKGIEAIQQTLLARPTKPDARPTARPSAAVRCRYQYPEQKSDRVILYGRLTHTRGVRWFGKKAVNMIAKRRLSPNATPPGPPPTPHGR